MGTPGKAEQAQFLDDVRCVDHGPLGLIDHLNLLPGGSTLRPVEHYFPLRATAAGKNQTHHVTIPRDEDKAMR